MMLRDDWKNEGRAKLTGTTREGKMEAKYEVEIHSDERGPSGHSWNQVEGESHEGSHSDEHSAMAMDSWMRRETGLHALRGPIREATSNEIPALFGRCPNSS